MQSGTVLLTFDLEEFDIPNEYGSNLSIEEQLFVGQQGMIAVNQVLDAQNIPTTIFTTAAYAIANRQQVKQLSQKHEIASHAFHHATFRQEDLLNSKQALEEITQQAVYGYRMPRMKAINIADIKQAGYVYDSSINPTIIPGKYNNSHLPKTCYKEQGLLRVPASVSPTLRLPLFWLAFKNFPYSYYRLLALKSLRAYGYINLYFHPWEFTDISKYQLPNYVKKDSGNRLLDKLDKLITDLQRQASFDTIINYIGNNQIL